MTAKAKIETLTNSWYGFVVFSAVCGLLANGIGVWSIFTGVVGLLFSFLWVFLWGRSLQKKSSLARWILILSSAFLTAGSAVAAAKATWMFVHVWELKVIAAATYSAVYGWMMAKSFRTLTDATVKAHFN